MIVLPLCEGTIPDGLQVTGSDASLSMEAARMPAARETDAVEHSEWSDFFDRQEDIEIPSRSGTFRQGRASLVKMSTFQHGPKLVAFSWSMQSGSHLCTSLKTYCPCSRRIYTAGKEGPILLCLHGGGYTGLTWAPLAKRVKKRCAVFHISRPNLLQSSPLPPSATQNTH